MSSELTTPAPDDGDRPPELTITVRSADLYAAFGELESRRRTRFLVDIKSADITSVDIASGAVASGAIASGAVASGALAATGFEERIPVIEGPRRTRYVRVTDVHWFEAHNQYVRLHVGNRSMLARAPALSITNLERCLDPRQFIRVHRSHIVNLHSVEAVETDGQSRRFVVLGGERRIPVSQHQWPRLRATLSRFGTTD